MTEQQILSILKNQKLDWNKVNDLPAINTFFQDFFINFCKWRKSGLDWITIEVDNIDSGENNIFFKDYNANQNIYKELLPIYETAQVKAVNILEPA